MIHKLLILTRPLFVLDTETTGTDPQKDRIVEIGFQQWDATGMIKEWRSLVNPGVPIPASAVAVHHIDPSIMDKCSRCYDEQSNHPKIGCEVFHPISYFKQLAANLAKEFIDCDYVGKNVRFDLRIMTAEMARAGQPWDYVGARIVDAERLEQLAVPRDLGALHEKYTGRRHDGAHGALSDVRASATVIMKQLEMFPNLPRDLDALHAAQWPNFIDNDGKFRFIDGVACFSRWGKYSGQPMRNADVGYWDFIISRDFPTDVKALASAAKLSHFPEQK